MTVAQTPNGGGPGGGWIWDKAVPGTVTPHPPPPLRRLTKIPAPPPYAGGATVGLASAYQALPDSFSRSAASCASLASEPPADSAWLAEDCAPLSEE